MAGRIQWHTPLERAVEFHLRIPSTRVNSIFHHLIDLNGSNVASMVAIMVSVITSFSIEAVVVVVGSELVGFASI